MSDKKISQLDPVTDVQDADEFVLARSGGNNKIDGASLKTAFAGGSAGGLLTATVTLTHAQILTLPTATTFEMIPPPGAGKMLVPLMAMFSSDCAAGAYTNIDVWSQANVFNGAVYLAWDAPTNFADATGPVQGAQLLGTTTPRVALTSAMAGQISVGVLEGGSTLSAVDVGTPDATANGYDNAGLYVVGQNAGGDFTGGDAANTLKVTVAYFVADV